MRLITIKITDQIDDQVLIEITKPILEKSEAFVGFPQKNGATIIITAEDDQEESINKLIEEIKKERKCIIDVISEEEIPYEF